MLLFAETFLIGEVVEKVGISRLTIITWETEGLIPRAQRDSRGWRRFTEDDIETIRRVATEHGLLERTGAEALVAL